MNEKYNGPVPYVIITKDAVTRDSPFRGHANRLRLPGNNGRKILVTECAPQEPFCEHVIGLDELEWRPPAILPTGEGGVEIATFTEFSGQDRHKHIKSMETYTVLKGTMDIHLNDTGPFTLSAGDEVVVLPGTIHQVCVRPRSERLPADDFALLVRVHAINAYGISDKYVQLSKDGEWRRWDTLSPEERKKAFRL